MKPSQSTQQANPGTGAPEAAGQRLEFLARGERVTGRTFGRSWVPVLAALALLLIFLFAISAHRLVDPTPRLRLPEAKPLALLPFVNGTGQNENRWIELALPEMLAHSLAENPGLNVVDPERVRALLASQKTVLVAGEDPVARRDLVLSLGAGFVIEALVGRDGEEYFAKLSAWDSAGELASLRLVRPDLSTLAAAMSEAIARGVDSTLEPMPFQQVFTGNAFLNRIYGVGLSELRLAGAEGVGSAKAYFEICLQQRPSFVQAQARLAESEALLGNVEHSRELYQALLPAAQQANLGHLLGRTLIRLGVLSALEGEFEQARTLHQQARTSFSTIASREGEQQVLNHLARLALTRADPRRAEELFFDQLQIQQDLGDRLGQADTYLQLGSLALARGELVGAEELFAEAGGLAGKLGDGLRQARAWTSLGAVARRRGDLTAAKELLQRALDFHRANATPRLVLMLTRDLARVAAEAGDRDLAERVYQELLALAVELADAPAEAQASLELAEVQLAGGYAYQARKHMQRAIELDRWLEDPLALAKVIARIAYEEHKFDLALRTMQGALRQEGEAARVEDQALLELFRRAQAEGRYFPVP